MSSPGILLQSAYWSKFKKTFQKEAMVARGAKEPQQMPDTL